VSEIIDAASVPGVEPDWRVREAILAIARRLPSCLRLALALVRDPRVPAAARRWLVAAGLYNLSPLDPIPGFIDDYSILLLAIRKALRACSPEVRDEHLAKTGVTEAQINRDLKEMRRIAGHMTRSAARGVWFGLQFAAGVGAELGRQLAISVARIVDPKAAFPGAKSKEEAAP
jgi:uncharacterized membrane protein YkvA (DUF1232 family)